ncbi:MAG: hypothetical protein MJZ89_06045 [Paludibacteraceae bacterium]|nr:hypothetical protein [Paludibacteraceae bacterium]
MIQLIHKMTLEFYDVPQLFVAADRLGVNYLCVLYKQDTEYHYLGVQLSELKLQSYLAGQLDLRMAYTSPEQENTLFEVVVANKKIQVKTALTQEDITDEMLPAPGFYHSPADAIDANATDTMELSIPVADRGFLADMAQRMGWIASTIKQGISKVAVL